ncbi:glutathionylspermidine synthase family protein [Burkholderia sp. Ac-20379]|uniref:glutathionylspermidine synthase family protein n=1 Tax=Burkholderia sp. Ac-20379 TaxID=2703900 RepID=UPI0019826F25|nr:glutathionylspermidine synthase family protein [Burkholderia sp. Ac-20379]MBN3728042.1 glutathionylspermidine synthase family protein [Burkholderia sp. Ac-20379]
MKRIAQSPRPDWPARLESIGFHFHSLDEDDVPQPVDRDTFVYWREDIAYAFSEDEIERLYAAALELNRRCLDAVEHVIEHDLFARLGIGARAGAWIRESWERDDPTLYGRFDLTIGADGQPKMYEYNADTPTSIIEASLAQWFWKEDVRPGDDQFNSLHESLIARWRWLRDHHRAVPLLHFACMYDSQEDVCNTEYLMDTAVQAGWAVKIIDVQDIGSDGNGRFVDLQGEPIELMFKLFPWEWMLTSAFGDELLKDRCRWIEPPWKAVLSNKGILPILWELFPEHPNLLEASFHEAHFSRRAHVKKPLLSREGANVTLVTPDGRRIETGGDYGHEGFVYQAFSPAAQFGDRYVTLGAWIVDDMPAGLCVREQAGLVATNTSNFVPHYFTHD